jgi:hypothetical protein
MCSGGGVKPGLVFRNARHLLLWTERGAARHAKILDTDQAWEVFERLEDAYFRAGEAASQGQQALPAPQPPPADPAALAREALLGTRWELTFDRLNGPTLFPIPAGALMIRPEKVADIIVDLMSGTFPKALLPGIIHAAAARLG